MSGPSGERAGGYAPRRGGDDARGGFRPRGSRDGGDDRSGRDNGERREWRGRRDEGRFERARPEPLGSGRARFSAEAELVELILCNAEVAARAASERVWEDFQDAQLKRLAEAIVARRASEAGQFEPTEMLVDLPRGMAERVSRRLVGANAVELQRAGDEWFTHRTERIARADRQALIARLRAAEHRRDETQVAAALVALQRDQVAAHAAHGIQPAAIATPLPDDREEEGDGYELDRGYDDDGRETYEDDGATAAGEASANRAHRAEAEAEPPPGGPASHVDDVPLDAADDYEPDFDTDTGDDS
jgi:hypothetical protein